MTQPPTIPPYRQTPGDGRPLRGLWIGLVCGAAVSAIVWTAAWHATVEGRHPIQWLTAIPAAKLLVASALWPSPKTRLAGVGLCVSIPLGFLIFFGSCFAHIAR